MLSFIIALSIVLPLNPTGCATVDATRLAGTIYAEARGEAAEGQIAVAWVVRNYRRLRTMTTHSELVDTAVDAIEKVFRDSSSPNDIIRDSLKFLTENIEDMIVEIDSEDAEEDMNNQLFEAAMDFMSGT